MFLTWSQFNYKNQGINIDMTLAKFETSQSFMSFIEKQSFLV